MSMYGKDEDECKTLFLCSIVIHSLDFGESTVTSDPAGLVVSVERATISFSTDWSIIEDDWYIRTYITHTCIIIL